MQFPPSLFSETILCFNEKKNKKQLFSNNYAIFFSLRINALFQPIFGVLIILFFCEKSHRICTSKFWLEKCISDGIRTGSSMSARLNKIITVPLYHPPCNITAKEETCSGDLQRHDLLLNKKKNEFQICHEPCSKTTKKLHQRISVKSNKTILKSLVIHNTTLLFGLNFCWGTQ